MPIKTPPKPVLLCFEDERENATAIADLGQLDLEVIACHHFPDGEIRLRLPPQLPQQVVILRTLNQPNEKLIELLLAAQTARDLGAQHLTLVAPYLAYMRQDIAFNAGESVSQKIVGRFLAGLFDAVITVDPHLHRVTRLQDALPVAHVIVLSGAPALSDLIAQRRQQPLLIGPDEESAQWLAVAASRHGFEYAVCRKTRHGDRSVQITLPSLPVAHRQVVLLDDVASTGETLAEAARLLLQAGATSVDVAVTHALFAGAAMQVLRVAGVGEVWSTDCVKHPSNAVSMAGAMALALTQIKITSQAVPQSVAPCRWVHGESPDPA